MAIAAISPEPEWAPESERACQDPECAQLRRRVAQLGRQVERLQERLANREKGEKWRRELRALPSKHISSTEKLVLEDQYAVHVGRAAHNRPSDKPLWIEGRAQRIGLSASTYGRALKVLDEQTGVIARTEQRDPETGHRRVIVQATDAFWDPRLFRRTVERDYGYRCRHCPEGTRVAERITHQVDVVQRTTHRKVYVCTGCGEVLAEETAVREEVIEQGEPKPGEVIEQPAPPTHNLSVGPPTQRYADSTKSIEGNRREESTGAGP